jgi:NAD(P)-dependent dehydrogenase (short-subunit alcohol dehydrogenase family)
MKLFNLNGKNAVVLGGGGVLGTSISEGLAEAGANVAICDLRADKAQSLAKKIESEYGVKAEGYELDAMNSDSLKKVCFDILKEFKSINILVNAVGGNVKEATTSETLSFFDLSNVALQKVVDLNLMAGAIMPSQVFGREMANSQEDGSIINISSMNYFRPLTRTPGYSAAKAAVSNFTQWLAVDLAQAYGEKIRVNAIAPGFFLTDQNRFLLTDPETGELKPRGNKIIQHTPMGRFGKPDDLIGTLIWLASDASKFVTGITIPVDGGFSAYSGV